MAQVQSTMSSRELELWGQYRKKYGPLNPVRKYDAGAALIASQINNAHGGKAKPLDFMVYGKEPEQDIIVNPDEFMSLLAKVGPEKGVN